MLSGQQVDFASLAALGRVVRETQEDIQRRKLSSLDLTKRDEKPVAICSLLHNDHETAVQIFLSPDQARLSLVGLDASSIVVHRLSKTLELASVIRIVSSARQMIVYCTVFPPLCLQVSQQTGARGLFCSLRFSFPSLFPRRKWMHLEP